jgi:hypothetical protein
MNVLCPVAVPRADVKPLAPRPRDLRGRRVGILDNSKPNADVLLSRLAELLVERAGAGPVRVWRKPGASRPATIIEEVAAASDVVLTGTAD